MAQNQFTTPSPDLENPVTRIGDVGAMLRVAAALDTGEVDPALERQQMLADLCRFIGVKIGSLPPESIGFPPEPVSTPVYPDQGICDLSPRMEQTLQHLLNGDSEKQVARKLDLSQHTVHVYVKALYRKLGVGTRAELLARHLRK